MAPHPLLLLLGEEQGAGMQDTGYYSCLLLATV